MELIKSYLSSRKQITKFDDVMSDADNVIFGVPQGSVIVVCKIPLLARRTRPKAAGRPSAARDDRVSCIQLS